MKNLLFSMHKTKSTLINEWSINNSVVCEKSNGTKGGILGNKEKVRGIWGNKEKFRGIATILFTHLHYIHISSIEHNIRVGARIQTFENEHV